MGSRLSRHTIGLVLLLTIAGYAQAQSAGPSVTAVGPVVAEETTTPEPPPATSPAEAPPPSEKYQKLEQTAIGGKGAPSDEGDSAKVGPSNWIGTTLLSLVGVLGLIFLGAYAIRRWAPRSLGGHRGSGPIRVVARWPLSSRQYVALVQMPARVLVIGVTGQQITRLAEITDEQEMAQLLSACPSGRSILGEGFDQLLGRHRRGMADESADDSPPAGASTRNALGRLAQLLGQVKSRLSRVQARSRA